MSLVPIKKPDGIECVRWEPKTAGSKRCLHYLTDTKCELPGGAPSDGNPICSEWRRVNDGGAKATGLAPEHSSPPLQAPSGPTTRGGADDAPEALTLTPPPPKAMSPERAALLDRAAKNLATRPSLMKVPLFGGGHATMVNPEPFSPAKEIPSDSIEALEAYGYELTIAGEELKTPITLVKALTKQKDERLEMTYRDAATLRLLVDAFPGARVIEIKRIKE